MKKYKAAFFLEYGDGSKAACSTGQTQANEHFLH